MYACVLMRASPSLSALKPRSIKLEAQKAFTILEPVCMYVCMYVSMYVRITMIIEVFQCACIHMNSPHET